MPGTGYKCCTKCGETKPLVDFYRKSSHSIGGRAAHCKQCDAAKCRRWEQENKTKRAELRKGEWRRTNPEKRKARDSLRQAVASGRITKPEKCSDCGDRITDPRELQGHHHDYSKPLEVEWLCRGCHNAQHRRTASDEAA